MLKYKKMSLFDSPEGSVLVHSCNAQGVWGSGIAAEFKKLYPRSFDQYNRSCEMIGVGKAQLCNQENKRRVVNLITSEDYGKNRDGKMVILVNTILALDDLMFLLPTDSKIYSNKFNSGMFKVPWSSTEAALQVFVERYKLDWTVCEYE